MGFRDRSRAGSGAGGEEDGPSELILGTAQVPRYRMTVDRPQEASKLARGATEGHVRAWNGGPGGRHLVAITVERFKRPSGARRLVEREVRAAIGVVDRFPVPDVEGAIGLRVERPGGMPDDGSDAFGNIVLFRLGNLGVVMSHLGPTSQPTEFLAGLATVQHRRLRPVD